LYHNFIGSWPGSLDRKRNYEEAKKQKRKNREGAKNIVLVDT
jgi:hypothetical protein